jgi:hypothetical protein
MPSSYSASLRFELQFTGENVNTWGIHLNTLFTRADFAIAGRAPVVMTGGTYILSTSNTGDDEARAAVIATTGSGGILRIPPVTKNYRIENNGSAVVTVTTGSGATATVDPGDVVDVSCDGTNVKAAGFNNQSLKQYISSIVLGTVSGLPATAGNEGKYMSVVGGVAVWKTPLTADIADYIADQAAKQATTIGTAAALALVL